MTTLIHSLRHRPLSILMGAAINIGGAATLLGHLR
ncbi:hypothetical protein PSP20601_04019 [Pandoraea sputorum]|uniref:Uncharacterized protein n=1 Tax=Pandoraea sputorum TaxID=93222 RepID=A0A239SK98_9BURK|nr:Uncharacterised protein [Pandoraea sputorum]VVE38656.1 hypothetical protein PSP20601_04019 [Pandoraea sputorum]VVE73924.1 hypothetical protein PSP31120_00098 [Pandoraea sputorum]VVE81191.1 hypothetical protein PSP31121_03087 [Pandoraea sputorum]